jgi:3-oxoacid CoA-transferase subunit A
MTIAEAEEVVDGYLDPEDVITPGVFVQRVVRVVNPIKDIEQRTVRVRAEV